MTTKPNNDSTTETGAGRTAEKERPIGWARAWHVAGEKPEKIKNEKGRWAWPPKFLFQPVGENKLFDNDIPLYDTARLLAERDALKKALERLIVPDGLQTVSHVYANLTDMDPASLDRRDVEFIQAVDEARALLATLAEGSALTAPQTGKERAT